MSTIPNLPKPPNKSAKKKKKTNKIFKKRQNPLISASTQPQNNGKQIQSKNVMNLDRHNIKNPPRKAGAELITQESLKLKGMG